MSGCGTCGGDHPSASRENPDCPTCVQWWADNPPGLTAIEHARESVVQAWLDGGFDPTLYESSFTAVRQGAWDSKMPVKIALTAYQKGLAG